MVDEVSACIDGFPKIGLATDHLKLNKFQSVEDNNYKLVVQQIRKCVIQAPGLIVARLNREFSISLPIKMLGFC